MLTAGLHLKIGNALTNIRLALVSTTMVFAALISLQASQKLTFPVEDAFHHGEFVAAAISALEGAPFDGTPFTIHGAADLFPALVVNLFAPARDMLLAYTLVLYPFLSMLAVLFTALAAVKLARRFGAEPLLLLPFILISVLCVGWRDLFFSLSLYLFAHLVPDERGKGGGPAAQILFGVVLALGTYWSFNRGVAALAAFGPPTFWLALRHRRFPLSVTTAVASFVVIGIAVPGIGVIGYFENLLILLQTSSQWSYPRSLSRDIWVALIIGSTAASIALTVFRIYRGELSVSCIVLVAPLLIASVVYSQIGLGRIDEVHIPMGAWLPLLVVTLLLPGSALKTPSWLTFGMVVAAAVVSNYLGRNHPEVWTYLARNHPGVWPLMATGLFMSAAVLGARVRGFLAPTMLVLSISALMLLTGKLSVQVRSGDYNWLRNISSLPVAKQAVTPGVLWSARTLMDSSAGCVFDLVNTGLINAVANLPACSRFTYPVYAGPQHESRLMDDLVRSAPPAIVYRANFWSYAIDGRPMTARFPALDAEILRRYPREACNHGYCLRFAQ